MQNAGQSSLMMGGDVFGGNFRGLTGANGYPSDLYHAQSQGGHWYYGQNSAQSFGNGN